MRPLSLPDNLSYNCADELHGTAELLKMRGVWTNFVQFQPVVYMSYINLVPFEELVHYQLSALPHADNELIALRNQVDIYITYPEACMSKSYLLLWLVICYDVALARHARYFQKP